jgi:pyrimidine 5'-nucleotidase
MIHTIFFDLDNTIYSRDSGLWEAIGNRINLYITDVLHIPEDQVYKIRQYCRDNYGTSLRGLKNLYEIDEEEYLAYVHDIDLSNILKDDGKLTKLFRLISQRKILFTNSDAAHAYRVLNFFNIRHHFDQIIDVISIKPYVKPQPEAFMKALSISNLSSPDGCMFIDDMIENIEQAKKLGFISILVGEPNEGYQHIPDIYMLPQILKSFESRKELDG